VVLDDDYLIAAACTIALNPVRARLVAPAGPAWSSLRAHLAGRGDGLVTVAPLIERLGRIDALIDTEPEAAVLARLRAAETTGRPLGTGDFVARLEAPMRRALRPQSLGAKRTPAHPRWPICSRVHRRMGNE
jgi:putative transposase